MIKRFVKNIKKINENLEQQAVALYQNALEINSDSLVYTTIGEICDVKGGKIKIIGDQCCLRHVSPLCC